MDGQQEKDVLELAMGAGHILLENGAEISRVEETIERICRHYGIRSEAEFVLSNGIFMTSSDGENSFAKVRHIPVSQTHFNKIAAVNQLSREIEAGKYSVSEAMEVLEQIRHMETEKKALQVLASGVGCGAFCYLFGGNLPDCTAAFFTGLLLYIFILRLTPLHLSKITLNIACGALVTMLCGLMYRLGIGMHMNFMIIASIMPLIPGVAFINAIREIADGDYLSGSVRMLDTLLVFFCIAMGVGIGFSLLYWLTGTIH